MAYHGTSRINGPTSVHSDEFKEHVGRFPKTKAELDEFARYTEKGIEAQIDWDVIYSCAAENFVGPRKKGERK